MRGMNFKFLKFLKQNGLETIPKILISCSLVILFFYSMPNIILYSKNKSLEFKNNSKAVLAYTLKNDGKLPDSDDEVLNEKSVGDRRYTISGIGFPSKMMESYGGFREPEKW